MKDREFDLYKHGVLERIKEVDHNIVSPFWWDTLIKYYFNAGFSKKQAARSILEIVRT
jgi:hypothetical protein